MALLYHIHRLIFPASFIMPPASLIISRGRNPEPTVRIRHASTLTSNCRQTSTFIDKKRAHSENGQAQLLYSLPISDMENNSKKNVEGSSAISAPATAAVEVGAGGPREDDDNLRRRISCHPLYGLLIQTHLDCLQASMADIEGLPINSPNQATNKINTSLPGSSDLDHFMEAYCMALSELKQAIEEPVQETTAFIDGMYFQLMQITGMGTHPTHTPPTSPGVESSRAHNDQESQFLNDLGGSTGDTSATTRL